MDITTSAPAPPAPLEASADKAARATADSPWSDPATLAALAGHPDPLVRQMLAGNRSTPPSALDYLAGDADRDVRMVLAGNSFAPVATIARLDDDPDPAVRTVAAQNTSRRLPPDWPERPVARPRPTGPVQMSLFGEEIGRP